MTLVHSNGPPISAVDPTTTTFRGSVRGADLPALVEFLSKLHQTACLELTHPEWAARLAFKDGRIVAAVCGDAHGMRAIVELRRLLDEAEFVYAETTNPFDEDVNLSVQQLREQFEQSDQVQESAPSIAVCPALGLVDDRRCYSTTPTGLHRCFAVTPPRRVGRDEQSDVCLTDYYRRCPRFQVARRAAADSGSTASVASLVPVVRVVLDQIVNDTPALPGREMPALGPGDATGLGLDGADADTRVPVKRQSESLLRALALALMLAAMLAWAYVLLRPLL